MQVIITKTGELKQVPDGYARNYLFPQNLATPATATGVEQAKVTQAKVAADQTARQSEYAGLAKTLGTTTVQLTAPANEHGKLFAAIHADQIVTAFQTLKLPITEEMISLPMIKQTGEHKVTVRIPGQSAVSVALMVSAA